MATQDYLNFKVTWANSQKVGHSVFCPTFIKYRAIFLFNIVHKWRWSNRL